MNMEDSTRKNIEGVRLEAEGKYEEALKTFTEAIAIDAENKAAWLNRSGVNHKLGREEEAVSDREMWESLSRTVETGQRRESESPQHERVEAEYAVPVEYKVGYTEKSPWGWGTLVAVCFFGSFAAGGIVVGINWRRMGKSELMWPTIGVSIVAFILLVYFLPEDVSRNTANLISLAPALGFWLWQKGSYRAWIESHPGALRAGWQIPLITVVIILGIFIGFIFLGGPVAGTAEWHYNQGVDLNEQGRNDEAIIEYNKAIELNPKLALAYNNRGWSYVNEGRINEALTDYDKAIELDPEFSLAYCNRGAAYGMRGEFDKALTDLNRSIELDSNEATAYFFRGLIYADMFLIQKAMDDLNKAVDLSDDPALIEIAEQYLDELR